MKTNLIIGFLVLTQILSAQSFTEAPQCRLFENIAVGSIAFADVNGDGYQDVLITGAISADDEIAKLYTNNGMGIFSEVPGTPFEAVTNGSIAFSDVNGDGDQDVLITGKNSSGTYISKLYTNNGAGIFSLAVGTPFEGVVDSSIAFADVNGDGDQDVLITGENNSGSYIAKLYLNNGVGTFSLAVVGIPFEGVLIGSIAFADVNGDGDQDVLITGWSGSNAFGYTSKLYTNNGSGAFSEVLGTPFEGVAASSIAFSDVNGDGDQDILITGENISGARISKLYTNNGAGTFSLAGGPPFVGVRYGSIAFADVNGDGDQDVLITGQSSSGTHISKLYANKGAGVFSEVTGTPFEGVSTSSIAFADVNGDGDQDVLITGYSNSVGAISKLYANNGAGAFSEVTVSPFERVSNGSVAFADVNGDGDQDVLITGYSNSAGAISKLYTNNGAGIFSLATGTPFVGVLFGSIAFADVNGDGDQDVLITGKSSSGSRIAKLYTNNGAGAFSLATGTPFTGVSEASIDFADVNGDGDQDVFITGDFGLGAISKLYTNNGVGVFSLATETSFLGVKNGSVAFADVNGDGDQDLLLTGQTLLGAYTSKLYTNNGTGTFSVATATPFTGVIYGSIAFADVNGDGDQDVLITGQNKPGAKIANLYINNGAGAFSLATGTPFTGVYKGSVAFADVNGDGAQDVLITGFDNLGGRVAKLYLNNGGVSSTDDFYTSNSPSEPYANNGAVSATDDFDTANNLDLRPFPNPATSTTLYLPYDAAETGEVTVNVYNAQGALLRRQSESAVTGKQNFPIDIVALTPGVYFIELDHGKTRGVAKFIVR
jgi:predicted nucleotidyltransferase